MKVKNSNDYDIAPMEITPQDLAILFDSCNLGIQRQMQITDELWENFKWILPAKYKRKSKKKVFIQDVLYQIDYLYNKKDVDNAAAFIAEDAKDVGVNLQEADLTESLDGISEYFKSVWLQLNFLSTTGYVRAKMRTILNRYHYKKRTGRFMTYFEECLYFYKIDSFVKGEPCNIYTVPLDTMITFRLRKRRKKRA